MTTTDFVTIAAIIIGPLASVSVTLWWQRRREKHDARMKLFLTLMAHRKQFPPSHQWVDSLNVIDVVFSGRRRVIDLWHRYYDQLHQNPATSNYQARDHAYLLMLVEMARSLGYKDLEMTDIDKFYSPVAHGEQHDLEEGLRREILRVLANTQTLATVPFPEEEPTDDDEHSPRRLANRRTK